MTPLWRAVFSATWALRAHRYSPRVPGRWEADAITAHAIKTADAAVSSARRVTREKRQKGKR